MSRAAIPNPSSPSRRWWREPVAIVVAGGVVMGLSLGVPARRLMFWMVCGIVLWTVGLTVAGIFSTAGILRLMGR